MNRATWFYCVALVYVLGMQPSLVVAADEEPLIVITGPTIIAFFPVTKAELQKDADTNEALADFQFYSKQVREPLKKTGIAFSEVYAHSFRTRFGQKATVFQPAEGNVGYYLIVPGKQPRIEYGVMTDTDLLQVANEYFGFAPSPEQPPKRKVECKIPKNVKSCYWTHGRLSIYNGNPTFRLWKIGTHRLLGIYSGPGFGPFDAGLNEEDDLDLPANLLGYDFTKVTVFGDFEVCPLAAEKEGRMQPACIESAKNLVSEKSTF